MAVKGLGTQYFEFEAEDRFEDDFIILPAVVFILTRRNEAENRYLKNKESQIQNSVSYRSFSDLGALLYDQRHDIVDIYGNWQKIPRGKSKFKE